MEVSSCLHIMVIIRIGTRVSAVAIHPAIPDLLIQASSQHPKTTFRLVCAVKRLLTSI